MQPVYYIPKKIESGIYCIRNVANGRIYIGSTVSFQKRQREHFNALKRNRHTNQFLQADYNKCGCGAFVFECVEAIEPSRLLLIEQDYLDRFFGKPNCYNLCPVAGNTLGRKFSEKTKKLMSEQRKGKNTGEQNGMFGKKHSTATRRLMVQNHRDYKGTKHPHYGKRHKTRAVIATHAVSGQVLEFVNARHAAQALELNSGGVSRNLNGKSRRVKNWRLTYAS